MATGKHDNNIIIVSLEPTTTSSNNVVIAPVPNIIKSNGLKTLNINVPLFAFAGIKNPFTMYHTPFISLISYYN